MSPPYPALSCIKITNRDVLNMVTQQHKAGGEQSLQRQTQTLFGLCVLLRSESSLKSGRRLSSAEAQ